MPVIAILTRLKTLGVTIRLDQSKAKPNLSINAPRGVLTPDLLGELKQYKEDIIEFLSRVSREDAFSLIEPAEVREYYPLSPAQKRLYLIHRMTPRSVVYNIYRSIPLDRTFTLNRERMAQVAAALVQRHESLRTSFHLVDGEPVQRLDTGTELAVEIFDLSRFPAGHDEYKSISREFIRPFRLSVSPLMRLGVLKDDKGQYILLVDIHHIIADGTSLDILKDDLMGLYSGNPAEPAALGYTDYCIWLNRDDREALIKKQEEFWLKRVTADMPALELPYDFPRPVTQSFDGYSVGFSFEARETTAIKKIVQQYDCTYFMVFLAMYNILLSKLSGLEQITVGTPAAGRPHDSLGSIIGMFVNTLVIPSNPGGEKTFEDFLKQVKADTVEAFDNQDYPFELLVDNVGVERDAGRNPLFDASFNWWNYSRFDIDVETSDGTQYQHFPTPVKFDLALSGMESGDKFLMKLEYCAALFKPLTASKFIRCFSQIVRQAVHQPGIKLADIQLLSPEEREHIIEAANSPKRSYPTEKLIHRLFEEQVQKTPDTTALPQPHPNVRTRLIASTSAPYPQSSVTYKKLDQLSSHLASNLIKKGVRTGHIVVLLLEPSVELIVSIIAILKAGGTYLALDTDSPLERIEYMVLDSGAGFVLDTDLHRLKEDGHRRVIFEKICILNILDLIHYRGLQQPRRDRSPTCPRSDSEIDHNNLAYIIYTSGSTGRPKGVPVTHGNLSPLLHWGHETLGIGPGDRMLQNVSFYFDWSVWETFFTLTSGASLVLVLKELKSQPAAMAECIRNEKITVLNATPGQYGYLIMEGRFFPSLRYLSIGGEKLTLDMLQRALQSVSPQCRVFNVYGPTETTILATSMEVTSWRDSPPDSSGLQGVPIGRPISNFLISIVDPHGNLCHVKVAGELIIEGPGVTQGYINNPELTAQKFLNHEEGEAHSSKLIAHREEKEKKLTGANEPSFPTSYELRAASLSYKTGDKVRWLEDGNIEFLGRFDSQVKIRGLRIELGEIEQQLAAVEPVKEALVMVRTGTGDEQYLCAYVVLHKPVDLDDIKNALGRVLPYYMIPPVIVPIGQVPLTVNGKVDRRALPDPGFSGEAYAPPGDELEARLINIWANVLGLDEKQIGVNDDYFRLGGHSLNATRMVSILHKELDVQLPLPELFKSRTVRSTALYIKEILVKRGDSESYQGFVALRPVEKREYYPMSSTQKRLFLIQQMTPGNMVYNMPLFLPVDPQTDADSLEKIFLALIDRHESLRTSFHVVNGLPVQRVHDSVDFHVDLISPHEDEKPASVAARLIRPFDLAQAPLLRAGLITNGSTPVLLFADIHHIISDGVSMEVVQKEFEAIAQSRELSPLNIQYKDYSQWQQGAGQQTVLKEQERYWLEQFNEEMNNEIPVLELPYDFPRPLMQSFEGSRYRLAIEPGPSGKLRELAQENEATPFMVLLSAYSVLLSRLAGLEDIVIGTPAAARRHADLQSIIGMFVNTLALRNYPTGSKTFLDFLAGVKKNTLAAFENQEYPFEELVEHVPVSRDTGRSPLFDVMFSFHGLSPSNGPVDPNNTDRDEMFVQDAFEAGIAKFDITLTIHESPTRYLINWEYCTALFKQDTVERFARYFNRIITSVTENPGTALKDIQLLDEAEQKTILDFLNTPKRNYPTNKTIHHLFEAQAQRTPGAISLIQPLPNVRTRFIASNSAPGQSSIISYKKLDELSTRLASNLTKKGVTPGHIVALMAQPSIEMIVGMLGIMKAGAAYLPLDIGAPGERVEYVLGDSGAVFVLDTDLHRLKEDFHGRFISKKISILPLLDLIDYQGPLRPRRDRSETCPPDDFPGDCNAFAYIIYTSGSTGRPKGVGVTHANFSPLAHWAFEHLGIGPGERVMQNLSYNFDWSVMEIFNTLTAGAALAVVPRDWQTQPDTLEAFIRYENITALHATPSQYSYLAREGRFFGTLNLLFFGGEKVTVDLMHKTFASVPTHCRVFNVYGPTEATIVSAVMEFTSWRQPPPHFPEVSSVPIGRPTANLFLSVVDRYGNLCPANVAGELIIAGDGVTNGYLNNPELTALSFFNHEEEKGEAHSSWLIARREEENKLAGANEPSFPTSYELRATSFYKSGDRVCWLEDGTFEYLGRMDTQVKIRGFRIELGEIERRLVELDAVKEAVVIVRKGGLEEEYLCGYVVVSSEEAGMETIRESLGHVLPYYMVPPVIVSIEQLPLNPNGKVDRRALPDPGFEGETYTPPADELEEKMTGIWANVLELDKSKIGVHDDYFRLGGHSLNAARLVSVIHKELDIKIPLPEIFQSRTIRELAFFIKKAQKEYAGGKDDTPHPGFAALQPVEKREYYPMSPAQRRLFFIQQMAPNNVVYNMPAFLPVEPGTKATDLEKIFRLLIQRHESFRTSFHAVDGLPVQRVHDAVEFAVDIVSHRSGEEPGAIAAQLIRPFDLSRAPLMRAALILSDSRPVFLFIDIHHVISDGVSVEVLQEEFAALAGGREMQPLKLQYKDYSLWLRGAGQQNALQHQERYWMDRFSDEIPVLELPYDFPRPVMQSFEGSRRRITLEPRPARRLNELAEESGATSFMVLLSIFAVLLSKLGNLEDIIIGTPAAARRHADLQRIIGMFVNTLALRNFPAGHKTFKEFLLEVKKNTLDAFENQEYSFEELVEHVSVRRDAGRSPLFDIMFSYLHQTGSGQDRNSNADNNAEPAPASPPGENPFEFPVSKFDITLTVMEQPAGFHVSWEYCTRLFKPETIDRFARYFTRIITIITQHPDTPIKDIQLMDETEKEKILNTLNNTACNYPKEKTIHHLFEEQVQKNPHKTALLQPLAKVRTRFIASTSAPRPSSTLTYTDLNRRASHIAAILTEKGVKTGHIVALILPRSIEMIIAILGTLKAGAAYMPIDPAYPDERKRFMLCDSGAVFVLDTDGHRLKEDFHRRFIDEKNGELPCLDLFNYQWPQRPRGDRSPTCPPYQFPPVSSSDTAYIIYTSGTTGKPKGCMIEHGNVVRLMMNERFQFDFDRNDTWTLFHSYCFDFSVWEMYGALLYGGRLVIVPGDVTRDPREFLDLLSRERVTVLNQTPAAFYQLSDCEIQRQGVPLNLKYVIFGGEALNPAQLKNFHEKYPGTRLINMFGITETTVHVTFKAIEAADIQSGISNIGRPIPTLSIFILDKYRTPVPRGVPGEICVGGQGVCRGYLNRPELTAERFLDTDGFVQEDKRQSTTFINHQSSIINLYFSGDLGRLTASGDVEYLGRADSQVKIRGHRVETGEIEFQLKTHPGIKDVVVTAVSPRGKSDGVKYLCAYVVLAEDAEKSQPVFRLVADYLADRVPPYMVPSYVVELEKIPLTPNGKVNRKAFPHPLDSELTGDDSYTAPQTELQKVIVSVWQAVLGRENVGIRDNFFDLGGTSLDLINVANQLKEKTGRDVPVVDLFTYPDIESLTRHLNTTHQEAPPEATDQQPDTTDLIDEGRDLMMDMLDDFDDDD